MLKDVQDIIKRHSTWQMAKNHSLPHDLYTPLPTRQGQWLDVSMDFMLALSQAQRNKDSIMVVVDQFSKVAHFLPCYKANDALHVVDSHLKVVVRLHNTPLSIVSHHESKFLTHV